MKKDVILTGFPRAGTTLSATLINILENSVCLSEPDSIVKIIEETTSVEEYIKKLEEEYDKTREFIIEKGVVINRVPVKGETLTNYYQRTEGGGIEDVFKVGDEKVMVKDNGFNLVYKHNAHFLSILPQLLEKERFSVLVVVRNPISVIKSWRSLHIPISEGRMPAGEKYWPELRTIAESNKDVLTKQVEIYELISKRILTFKEHVEIVYYEDILKQNSLYEKVFCQKSVTSLPEIKNQNKSEHYNHNETETILNKLKEVGDWTFKLYENPEQYFQG
ncbi:MAG: sulfotransferase domain-containing protein [Nitrospinae bacterium]|nr:sulfotransferase domain-containing protein [Nitrospinota bacterium]